MFNIIFQQLLNFKLKHLVSRLYVLWIFVCIGEGDSNVTNRGLRWFMIVIIKWSKAIIFLYSQCFSSEITVDICVLGAVSEWSWNNERNVVWIFLGGWHLHKTNTCYIAKNDMTFRSRWLVISINCLFWKCHKGDLLTTKNFNKIHLINVERKEKRGNIFDFHFQNIILALAYI